VNAKKLVIDPEAAELVKLMFEMYAQPGVSFGDITRYFTEHGIYGEMQKKMSVFQTLSSGATRANPKLTALKVELVQVENEIKQLLGTLTGANATLLSYANSMIEELDTKRQALLSSIAEATTQAMSTAQMEQITSHLDSWDNLSFEDKRTVAGGLLTRVKATSKSIQIEWKL